MTDTCTVFLSKVKYWWKADEFCIAERWIVYDIIRAHEFCCDFMFLLITSRVGFFMWLTEYSRRKSYVQKYNTGSASNFDWQIMVSLLTCTDISALQWRACDQMMKSKVHNFVILLLLFFSGTSYNLYVTFCDENQVTIFFQVHVHVYIKCVTYTYVYKFELYTYKVWVGTTRELPSHDDHGSSDR